MFENGSKTSLRHVVVDVMIIDKDKILLVKRALHLTNGGKYGLVGGYVERDERIEEAAKREVFEETGYKIRIQKLLRINDSPNRPKEDKQNIAFVYLAQPESKQPQNSNEVSEFHWFKFDKLPKPEDIAFDHLENIQLYLKQKDVNRK